MACEWSGTSSTVYKPKIQWNKLELYSLTHLNTKENVTGKLNQDEGAKDCLERLSREIIC